LCGSVAGALIPWLYFTLTNGQAWAPRCQCHIWTLADSYTFSTMEEWRCIIHLFFTVYGLSTWLDKYCNVQNKYSIEFYLHHSSKVSKA